MAKGIFLMVAGVMALTPICGGRLAAADPPAGGTISIQRKTADGEYESSMPAFVNAATEALAAKGFTILEDPGHAAYVGELTLSRAEVGTGTAKASKGRTDAMPGGAGGSVGAGVIIPLPTGKSRLVPLQRVQLELRIRKRGEDGIVWHGAAVTVRAGGTKKGADEVVAADLSNALLRSYPAVPEDVVGVP